MAGRRPWLAALLLLASLGALVAPARGVSPRAINLLRVEVGAAEPRILLAVTRQSGRRAAAHARPSLAVARDGVQNAQTRVAACACAGDEEEYRAEQCECLIVLLLLRQRAGAEM